MNSPIKYYKERLTLYDENVKKISVNIKMPQIHITGKKRKYEEAMGYPNDYESVQITCNVKNEE